MNRKSLRNIFFFLLFSNLLFWAGNGAFSSSPHFNFNIQSHSLKIQIDPPSHTLKAEDQIEISLKGGTAQTLSFLLHSKLRITEIVNLKTKKPLFWKEVPYSDIVKRLDVPLKKEDNRLFLSISYEGPIYDPVVKEKALQFVKGDETSGLIGSEGVYLSSSSHWFPNKPRSMAIFNLEATIPEPFRVVTQGELLSEELKDGFWRSKWRNEWPAEGFALVAGKYSVKSRKANGVKVSTYFFREDDRFSEIFLDGAEEYLKIYPELLGPFPYRKFDIVQNFFSSGYSFPTFTLLAPEAIRRGKEFLRPGALDHEIVHSWWGHHVSGKPGTGNWSEALTTYCTNYFYKELKLGEETARKHRQDVMQKYAIQVPHTKDYPLRQFEGKEGEIDGQIGYGKGSMVFHMLRQMVGKDRFFATLKNFSRKYGGRQATWDDFKMAFEEAGVKKLDQFFSQWLDRPGGPQLKLEKIGYQVTSGGYLVSGEVVQEGEIYETQVEVGVDVGERRKDLLFDISKRRNSFSMEIPKIPISLTLDPDHHIFRRLYPEEIIPGLNAMLEDPHKIFVVSDREDEEKRKIYTQLARMAKERKGGEVLAEREMAEEKISGSSFMLLGESWKNPLFSKLISKIPGPVMLKEGNFIVDGEKVDDAEESVLITYPHPLRHGKWVTIYFGQSAEGLSRARYIFFYGWDSYILFKKGKPEKRGGFSQPHSFTSYDFLSEDHFNKIEPEKLKDHVSFLVSSELAGRFPGTSGYGKAQKYLIKKLEEMGISPIVQSFNITIRDIERSDVISKKSMREVKAIPFSLSKDGKWEGPFLFLGQSQTKNERDFSGKGVIIDPDFPKNTSDEFLMERIRELQSRGAKAILILLKEGVLDSLAPYMTYPSYFPPRLEEKLKNREEEGYYVQRSIEASKVSSRAKTLDFPIRIPVFFIPYSPREGWIKGLREEETHFEVSLRFKEIHLRDMNIGGIIYGNDSGKKGEFLILGAHYDHLGKDEEKGVYYSGADDNASGVAALLEVSHALMERKKDLKRNVILLFTGGEEWGLKGSEHFVESPFVPLPQIKAALSIDAIGGPTEGKEVFFIGGSFHPSLAERSRRFLKPLGMKEGRDIDRYAFTFGSDHYPFHQRGIPSLDYFSSDYKKLHTLRDNLEAIDFDHLAEVTRLIYLTAYEYLTEP